MTGLSWRSGHPDLFAHSLLVRARKTDPHVPLSGATSIGTQQIRQSVIHRPVNGRLKD